MTRVFIANRGEVALRIVRTLRDLGMTSILAYTPEDIDNPATAAADEAYALAPGQRYGDVTAMVEMASRVGADAVHPGYGYLSERPDFVCALAERGIIFLGPSADAMEALGDKQQARLTACAAGVSPVPGLHENVTDPSVVADFAREHGYPVALKRTDGGGGRGITIIHNDSELADTPALTAAAVNGARLILERYLHHARHIETQCVRDSHGAFAVVSTRDCSVQRRHQKLLEEAPAPFLPDGVDAALEHASRALFEQVNYVGVGTCEFLLNEDGSVYFLEVNPRLQVEHCVSEEVSGIDLVALQIAIAQGGHLPQVPHPQGHSIELRMTCEDPARYLAPQTGTITALQWPAGLGIRMESGVSVGDVVTPLFDPMLAKIVVTGPDRPTALARARRALAEVHVEGVTICTDLHRAVLAHPDFCEGRMSTQWVEREILPALAAEAGGPEAAEAAGSAGAAGEAGSSSTAEMPVDAMQVQPEPRTSIVVEINGRRTNVTIPQRLLAALGGAPMAQPQDADQPASTSFSASSFSARSAARPASARIQPVRARSQAVRVTSVSSPPRLTHVSEPSAAAAAQSPGDVRAPMQAIVTKVAVQEGDTVSTGQLVVVIESMKMENYVYAPCDGTVDRVCAQAGFTVASGELLCHISSEEQA